MPFHEWLWPLQSRHFEDGTIGDSFGARGEDIPACAVETTPGDVVFFPPQPLSRCLRQVPRAALRCLQVCHPARHRGQAAVHAALRILRLRRRSSAPSKAPAALHCRGSNCIGPTGESTGDLTRPIPMAIAAQLGWRASPSSAPTAAGRPSRGQSSAACQSPRSSPTSPVADLRTTARRLLCTGS